MSLRPTHTAASDRNAFLRLHDVALCVHAMWLICATVKEHLVAPTY